MTATLQSLDALVDGDSSFGFTNYGKLKDDIDLLIRSADGILSPGLYKLWDSVDAGVTLPAGSVTTPTLPTTFKHLVVEIHMRTDRVSTNDGILLRFNGDSGANYYYEQLGVTGTASPAVGEAIGVTSLQLEVATGANAPAGCYGACVIEIPYYSNALYGKVLTSHAAARTGSATNGITYGGTAGAWAGTAAISTITFAPVSGVNIVAGSRFTVYGRA